MMSFILSIDTVGKSYITIYHKTIWIHTNFIIFFETSRVRRYSIGSSIDVVVKIKTNTTM